MNRTKLKTYAPQARRDFIQAVTQRAAFFGLTKAAIEPITERGDVAIINGKPFPRSVADKRRRLEERIARHGFEAVMEAAAYTWFNRLVAIRFMELHGYFDHGYRVLSNPDKTKSIPEILEHAEHIDLPSLDKEHVIALKLDGTKEAELYQKLLIAQCNALQSAMPFLFERIDDETELLLPDNLLNSDSLIRKLVDEIDGAHWQEVEIIGWLYQFYISEKMRDVIGKVVKSEDIPAATQLFTPNWVVKYLVQNTLGRKWLETYPTSALRQKMAFYIEPAEQTPEVQEQLKAITPTSLNPEELTMIDPACGSGHILVEGYDLLKEIYLERGYRLRDIPKLILSKNLFGLEIDDRAAQLAAFALMMKARADDRRIFDDDVQPNVLAIQESNGLNVNAIVQAFTETRITNEDDFDTGQFGFMATARAPLFAIENRTTATVDDKLVADLKMLFAVFENAKTYGSLLTIPANLAQRLPAIINALRVAAESEHLSVQHVAGTSSVFVNLATLLSRQFDCAVANPPYMGSKYYAPKLRTYVNKEYKDAKADLYGCFIQRNINFVRPSGFVGMITIPNWMFLSSFEELRHSLFDCKTIDTFIHNGRGVFGSDFGSCSFVYRNVSLAYYRGIFRRLFDKQGSVASNTELAQRFGSAKSFTSTNTDFAKITGSPVAYWASPAIRTAFSDSLNLSSIGRTKVGLQTGDNNLFLRLWHEVSSLNSCFTATSRTDAQRSGKKWFPCNKGGPFRKWFGNNYFVVNWRNDGEDIRWDKGEKLRKGLILESNSQPKNTDSYFKEGITWTTVTISTLSMRYSPSSHMFETKGAMYFCENQTQLKYVLGFANSAVAMTFLGILSPTVDFHEGPFLNLPLVLKNESTVAGLVDQCVQIARKDWNNAETSWDFAQLPILRMSSSLKTIEMSAQHCDQETLAAVVQMRTFQQEINRLFIEAYRLQDELSPEVPDDQITLYRPDREEDMRRLISYAIGCAMGRYSLDRPGLIYANSGNERFDPAAYATFPADKDGIIPVTEEQWFADDAAARFEEFVGKGWKPEHLDENLAFVADGLGAKASESPRQTIRRYLSDGFYKHHLQTYKRRPIYWLFTSGKQRAFQCLVYLHRYSEGTLARMRTQYVIPLQGKIAARIEHLEGDKGKAAPTLRKRLEKEQDLLRKHQEELVKFDEKLRHLADERIKVDLDDGVKVNYRKFGDLLGQVKAITGVKDED